mmetsp:Transcript_27759/g.60836  ORF Transcript_27759/g.60836 Transcript_27759/m.60836 type:complete len:197 (-) Transcript_27759:299-889(-)
MCAYQGSAVHNFFLGKHFLLCICMAAQDENVRYSSTNALLILRSDRASASARWASQDTLQQLSEFEDSLQKTLSGNLTMQSELEVTKLAIRAAISKAFKTPQVIRLFAQKQPAALRERLAQIDRDVKLGKADHDAVAEQAAEILTALKKLGEPLAPKEEAFLRKHQTRDLCDFEAVAEEGDVHLPGHSASSTTSRQ